MILLIGGASHTGKTFLAQRLLEKYKYPYLSIDHLKMGLIRSGQTDLTPCDDAQLILYLWPIVQEIIKTAIENGQNLIVEGCYIPFDWAKDFEEAFREQIRYVCLIMTERYINSHTEDIFQYESVIEQRAPDNSSSIKALVKDNAYHLAMCQKHKCESLLIDQEYSVDIVL